jgi:hypothetical protein
VIEAPPKRRVSSANWEWFMLFTPLTIQIPGSKPLFQSYSNFLLKYSTIIMYNKGDRGKPCLNPLLALKNLVGCPLTKGEIQGLLIHVEIHQMKSITKSKLMEDIKNKRVSHPIKSISHINLDYHSFIPFGFARMYCFLD